MENMPLKLIKLMEKLKVINIRFRNIYQAFKKESLWWEYMSMF